MKRVTGIGSTFFRAKDAPALHDTIDESEYGKVAWVIGPEYWPSLRERMDARCVRVEQDEWAAPRCADWVATPNEAIARTDGHVAFVARGGARRGTHRAVRRHGRSGDGAVTYLPADHGSSVNGRGCLID